MIDRDSEIPIQESRRRLESAEAAWPGWEALYETHGESVFRFVYRMVRDPALAEDFTHDTFVRAHRRRLQYAGRGSVRSWLFQIAVNLVRDDSRRRTRRASTLRSLAGDRANSPVIEARLSVRSALAALGEEQRIVVLLHDVEGLTHPEIAAVLGVPEGTSRARLTRARANLRIALSGSTEEES